MADLDIANDALILIGETTLSALSERGTDLEIILSRERKRVLALLAPTFARKRARATAAGILDCSAKTITFADADPDTITDSGSGFVTAGFEAGDLVGVSGAGSNVADFGITTVVAGTLTLDTHETVTAEVLTNNADLKLYAKPADKWAYKYAKPSGCLKVLKVNDDKSGWATEGKYIVTSKIDSNDQVNLWYVQDITDYNFYTDLFKELWAIKLASVLAITIKESVEEAKYWNKHFDYRLKQEFREEAYESNDDSDAIEDSGWQTYGR